MLCFRRVALALHLLCVAVAGFRTHGADATEHSGFRCTICDRNALRVTLESRLSSVRFLLYAQSGVIDEFASLLCRSIEFSFLLFALVVAVTSMPPPRGMHCAKRGSCFYLFFNTNTMYHVRDHDHALCVLIVLPVFLWGVSTSRKPFPDNKRPRGTTETPSSSEKGSLDKFVT